MTAHGVEPWYGQTDYEIKFDWGAEGLLALRPFSDVIVVVDVLSFTTCVTVACEAGALVYPFPWKDERGAAFAAQVGAELAGRRGSGSRISLSPASLRQLTRGEKVVLPSPNGSQLSTETGTTPTIAASLRNASAAAKRAAKIGRRITVIAAGERWSESGTLRPALEDLIGAGAVISALTGSKSPEANAAQTVYEASRSELRQIVLFCASGRELDAIGYRDDVEIATELDVAEVAPLLSEKCYVV